jgi:hypothetical protein
MEKSMAEIARQNFSPQKLQFDVVNAAARSSDD